MPDNHFVLLWGRILDSTVWLLSLETRIVWLTLLCLKDEDGIVRYPVPIIANKARVGLSECEKALSELSSPDKHSHTKTDEGRRIREVAEGYFVINHEEYRFSTEARRLAWREMKQHQRDRMKATNAAKKNGKGKGKKGPLPGENKFVEAFKNGDEAEMDRLTDTPLAVLRGKEDGQ